MTATIDEVRQELTDIARWAPLMPATWSDMPVRASRIGDGVHVRMSHTPMPGGLERAIDTWDLNGPLGIHTQVGVRQALGPIVDEIYPARELLDATSAPPTRNVLDLISYLRDNMPWACEHMGNTWWQMKCADIHAVWERVQHLVCPPVERAGTCPECGARIEWVMGSEGRVNIPICPAGHTIRNLFAQQLQRIRNADEQDAPAYATMKEVQQLFPTLKGGTLRKWVFEEKVRKEGSRYCVNDIATRMASTQPAA